MLFKMEKHTFFSRSVSTRDVSPVLLKIKKTHDYYRKRTGIPVRTNTLNKTRFFLYSS